MKTKIMIVALVVALTGCSKSIQTEFVDEPVSEPIVEVVPAKKRDTPWKIIHTNPPPEFYIACDIDKGLYAPCHGNNIYPGQKHTNRQSAIDHAWWLYERLTNIPPSSPNWKICE